MKIIVNRGFDKLFARIVIGKDAQKTISCPTQQDYYDLDTKKGEQIVVKLRYPSTFTYTIASIDADDDNQVYYICPTGLFKKWTALNYMLLPGICLLLFILENSCTRFVRPHFCRFNGFMGIIPDLYGLLSALSTYT